MMIATNWRATTPWFRPTPCTKIQRATPCNTHACAQHHAQARSPPRERTCRVCRSLCPKWCQTQATCQHMAHVSETSLENNLGPMRALAEYPYKRGLRQVFRATMSQHASLDTPANSTISAMPKSPSKKSSEKPSNKPSTKHPTSIHIEGNNACCEDVPNEMANPKSIQKASQKHPKGTLAPPHEPSCALLRGAPFGYTTPPHERESPLQDPEATGSAWPWLPCGCRQTQNYIQYMSGRRRADARNSVTCGHPATNRGCPKGPVLALRRLQKNKPNSWAALSTM